MDGCRGDGDRTACVQTRASWGLKAYPLTCERARPRGAWPVSRGSLRPIRKPVSAEHWTCLEADSPSGWSHEHFERFVERQTWIFARTMPENPHEYTLRRDTDSATFDAAVRYIREQGILESFRGKPYKTLYVGEHLYWTMGAPLIDTILINRKLRAA